jgi:hypothetical protein
LALLPAAEALPMQLLSAPSEAACSPHRLHPDQKDILLVVAPVQETLHLRHQLQLDIEESLQLQVPPLLELALLPPTLLA